MSHQNGFSCISPRKCPSLQYNSPKTNFVWTLKTTDFFLLLAEASRNQAKILNSVLDVFCHSSGPKVIRTKTHVFFSKNISRGEANNNGKLLGYTITKDLGNYLCMSLIHSRVSNRVYDEIIKIVERHLFGSVAFHLSLAGWIAGRITLAQSVLQAIPIYAMQTTNLPLEVRTKIVERHLFEQSTFNENGVGSHCFANKSLVSGFMFKVWDLTF